MCVCVCVCISVCVTLDQFSIIRSFKAAILTERIQQNND